MKRALSWGVWILGALVVGFLMREYVVGTARVVGSSMEPTLYNTDIVLLTKFDYWLSGPRRGDVALCTLPGREQTYLKRVAAVPGDSFQIFEGVAYLNGEAIDERYASGTEYCDDYAVSLGMGEYLVLGDNRLESYDSRAEDVGVLAEEDFIGRARFHLWPIEKFFFGIY
jgi:signal peptidase I